MSATPWNSCLRQTAAARSRERFGIRSRLNLLAIPIVFLAITLVAAAAPLARTALTTSNVVVPAEDIASGTLTPVDEVAPMTFGVALKMRNYAELLARIAAGEIIPREEMEARYYPLESDYQAVVDWLQGEGFTISRTDPARLGVFATATAAQIQQSMQVSFARVEVAGKAYTSAVTAPTLPASISGPVLGVNGLQPQLQPHKHSRFLPLGPSAATGNSPPFLTAEILKAYQANGLAFNGTGQKIGIVIDTFPANSDLTSFWTSSSVPQSLSNIETVQVISGTLPAPSGEETLDVEWSSGIASGAKVRVYASLTLAFVSLDQCYQAILNDLPTNPGLRQISLSYGLGETYASAAQMQTDAQYFASLAAAGVTVFASAGDGGSSPGPGGHDHTGPVQAETPSTDVNVMAVGGTSLTLNAATGVPTSESAWFDGGGGNSIVFNRPAWQVGTGLPAGTARVVPDIASAGDPATGCLVVLGGTNQQVGGTSWSSPMWAGFCALINQARTAAGFAPLGSLGPKIYPLLGTSNFRDITSGSNGTGGIYDAGVGFDRCTGIGVPAVATLIQTLTSNGASLPNLSPAQPSGWTDNIVISTTTGTNTDSASLTAVDPLFLDFAVQNNGTVSAAAQFTTELYVDGVLRTTFQNTPPLAVNAFATVTDYALGMLGVGTHTIRIKVDSTNAVAETSEFDNEYTKTITVTPGLLFDSFTGASVTSSGSTPRSFMGFAATLSSAGGTSNINITGGTAYLVSQATVNYTNIRLRVTFWGTASLATSGATPAFSNSLGTYSFDLGAFNAVTNTFYPIPFTLPAPVVLPGQTAGITFNWQGDTGGGLVSTDNLTSLIRHTGAMAVGSLPLGTAGINGYYRNASSETNDNFLGSSFRTLGLNIQGLALQLLGTPGSNTAPTATNLSAAETYTEDTALNLIDIVASDADSPNVTATLTLSTTAAGSLSTATSGSVTSTYNAGTGVWTASGPIANVNTLLAGVIFTPAANFNTSFSITTSVSDGALSVTGSKAMTGTPVNDAPTATNLSAAETYTEDTTLNLIDIVASDIDSTSVTATLTLSLPGAGSLSTGTSGAVTSTYVAGTGVWTAAGPIANVNTLLAGVIFTPAANFNTSFSISTSVSDGALSVTGSKTMTGTPVNDAPTATNLSAAEAYTEDTALNLIDIVASDIDSTSVTATLTLSTPTAGSLSTATSGAVTSTYVAGTGVWTASGGIADVNALLAGVLFSPAANFNSAFSISTSISDGALSVTGSKTMTGNAVNDAPTATNLSAAETYTEDTALNLIDIVASDIDSASVTATLTLSLPSAGSLNTATSGAVTSTYVAATGVWTASGAIANVNTLLAGVTFTPAANSSTSFSIATSVSDGALSVSGSKTMTGTPVNDPPTATNLSATETYTEDIALNLIDIVASDIDSASVTATLTLSLPSAGSLSTATSGAVTSTYVAGTGVWTAVGAIADVNTLLAGVTFTPASNFNSTFTISTSVSDGALSVTGSKTMTGTPVNDAPTATNLSAAESYTEDTALNLVDIVISDVDSPNVTATLTLSNSSAGSLNTATSGAVTSTFSLGAWTASGAIADVNALLAGLTFTPATNFNANFTITTNVSDGLASSIIGSKAFTGTAVNDAPTATNLSAAETYTEDTALNLIDIVASDVDSANVTATLTLSNPAAGSLSTGTSGAVTSTYVAGTGIWTASGAIANVNTLLAGVVFTPASDFNANFTITTNVSDGSLNVGGSKTMTGTAVNDAPTATNLSAAETYTEDTALNLIDIIASDIDSASVTVTLTLSTTAAGSLSTATSGAVTSTYVAGTGVWTASGAIANVNTLLAGVTFNPATDFNSNFTISTSVSDGALSVTGSKTMTGTAVNDAPTATNLSAAETYTEDTALNLIDIVASDVDSANLTATLTLSPAAAGSLSTATSGAVTSTYVAGTGVWTATGPIANVNTLLAGVTFTPAANFNSSFTIATSVSDGVAAAITGSKAMTGTPVNDAPVLDATRSPVLTAESEDAGAPSGPVGTLVLNFVDFAVPAGQVDNIADIDAAALTGVAVTAANTSNGTWFFSTDGGTVWTPLGAVSDAGARLLAADAGTRIYFQPATDFNGTLASAITFRAWDQTAGANGDVASAAANGGITAFSTATDTASLTINPINDAPVLDATRSPALAAINEDAGAPIGPVGTLVLNLVDFATPAGQVDNITDPDASPLLGIAITAADTSNGTWFYTLDDGASWNPLGAVSDASARLLAANAGIRVYFQPAANFNGTLASAVTFRAWDQTAGATGDLASTTSNGGITAFSTATDAASLTVNAVNDAPVLDTSSSPVLVAESEDAGAPSGPVGTLVSSLVDFATPAGELDNVTEVDAGALTGIAVVAADTSNGTWFFSTDGGSAWTALGAVNGASARLLAADVSTRVYFQPAPDFNGTITNAIAFRAWDQTAGANGDLASTTSNGGITAFSTATDTAGLAIVAVNDAPVLDAARSPVLAAVNEDAGAPFGPVGTLVSSLADFATPAGQLDNITDVDAGALTGIAIVAANSSNGTWFFSTDGGIGWNPLGAVNDAGARLLAADADTRVYFQPAPNFSGTLATAIAFRAWDRTVGANGDVTSTTSNGGTTAFSAVTDTASLTVNAINDAPVLDATRSPALTAVNEDAGAPLGSVGTLVSSLIDFATPPGQLDNVTDPDGIALTGIAITATDTNNGAWFFSTDGGNAWTPLGAVSDASARLLAADPDTRIYFQPAPDFNGTLASAITFRAWDQTAAGGNGDVASTASNGGTTAFSIATDTASLTIIAINDAPVLDTTRSPVLVAENEDASAPTGAVGTPVSSLVDFATPAGQLDNLTDVDSGALAGIAIVAADTSNGTWFFSTNGGAAWSPLGAVNDVGARLLAADASTRIYFRPAANFNGTLTSAITFRAWDRTSGANGNVTSAANNGGITAFSLATDTASLTIIPVNDAPTLDAIANPVVILEDAPAQIINLSGITAGAGETQGLTVTATSDNPALIPDPTITYTSADPTGALHYTPVADANGTATITVTVKDDGGTANSGSDTTTRSFIVNVTAVNDAPSFTKGADVTVLEDAGPQTMPGWASSISAGPANESAQVLGFIVTADQPALFSTQPAISAAGTLTFTRVADVNGTATISVALHDNGGTADNGVDASAVQTFTISTTPVNDAPTFVAGPNIDTAQDAGPQNFPAWATAISAGPGEAGQAVHFIVDVDKPELFATPPTITSTGTLAYAPAPAGSGVAKMTVRLQDDGGTADSGANTSAPQTVEIAITSFLEELGSYTGIVQPAAGGSRENARTGAVQWKVAKGGKFTGKVTLAGKAASFKGAIGHDGVAHFGKVPASTFTINRKGLPPLDLALKVEVARGTNTFSGSIRQSAGAFASIDGDRSLYTSKRNPALPLRNVPAALLGNYTVVLPALTPAEQTQPASAFPQGDGYGRLIVTPKGAARLTATLADGSKVSASAPLALSGRWPLYRAFGKTGSVSGFAIFEDVPDTSDVDASGLQWFKAANARAHQYPAGWPAGILVNFAGSKYTAPSRRAPGPVLPGLGTADTDGNAALTFSDGGLDASGLVLALAIDADNHPTLLTATTPKSTFALSAKTGLLSGKFLHSISGKPTTFGGAVLQKQKLGAGFFLGLTESGAVSLVPDDQPAVP